MTQPIGKLALETSTNAIALNINMIENGRKSL
jgi:hypothetical protein